MNQSIARIIMGSILLFHIFITVHAVYVMFSDYNGMTIEHAHPLALLLFTGCWLGVFLRKRIFGLLYLSLVIIELMMKMFFGRYPYGEVFGSVLFPADVLFIFVILILYKQIFGERSAQQEPAN